MKTIYIVSSFLLVIAISFFSSKKEGKHLFILSGQSNMQLLKPKESFIPVLKKKFGAKNIITVKYAKGAQPIRRWYRDWKPAKGNDPKAEPYLYDSLMIRVKKAIDKKKIASVTFVWMQGERDARKNHGEVYEQSLLGLYKQLSKDLNRADINFVIGRISDFGLKKKKWAHWKMIREVQVKVAESNPRFDWVNTDDLNTGRNRKGNEIKDNIHMSVNGYVVMGERFAEKAIKLIESNK
ncbi:sialate O-acetylesterase [Tenacibaculum xiamenense]|uniref:sialate O-acetylesterase n=1 Tax=Tenacibaculum xiamenense TaxID=1261553 RepID=UPI003893F966